MSFWPFTQCFPSSKWVTSQTSTFWAAKTFVRTEYGVFRHLDAHGWWRSSADFSDLNDLNMRERKPLYPFGSNSLKTWAVQRCRIRKTEKSPAPQSVPCVVEDAAVYVKWFSRADKPESP